MARFLVAAIADLGHRELALEPAPHPIVNTLGFPPCLLNTLVAVRLVTLEWLGAFFYDWRLDGHGEILAEVDGNVVCRCTWEGDVQNVTTFGK